MPLSFAGCGGLLLTLFVVLVGCASFGASPDFQNVKEEPHDLNAVLCACECDGFFDPVPPSQITIGLSEDDGTQVFPQTGMTLNRTFLVLGENNNVGLRFKLGVPQGAHIDSASIQFSAAQDDAGDFDFTIHVVDSPNAPPFTAATDLRDGQGVNLIGISVPWKGTNGDTDWVMNERLENEKSPDLAGLVQNIVDRNGFIPNNAIEFVIRGSGRRHAVSYDGAGAGALKVSKPPTLTVVYTPKKIVQNILTCGDPNDKQNVCGQKLQTVVNGLANMCKVSHTCTCKVAPGTAQDVTQFSAVCNDHNAPNGCPAAAPESCDPGHIAKATIAKPGDQPVCVASSPVGSVLFGRLTACEIEGTPNCNLDDRPDDSCVSVRVFDSDDSLTRWGTPRGRIEFKETPCSPGSRCYGMTHRIRISDLTFSSGTILGDLFEGDHTVVDLSGAGASTVNVQVNGVGQGTFGSHATNHSVRGTEVGGATAAAFSPSNTPIDFGLGGWQSNGVCTLRGFVLNSSNFQMFANIKGKLVNQPPTATIAAEGPVECNDIGRALFALDATPGDPDNNVASFGWYRDSRTGPLVGTLPSVELEQPLGETSYVFKVLDTFGQYAEAIASVKVVDTTAPTLTAPGAKTVECTGQLTPVALGTASATDVCDASPTITNDAGINFPQGFPVGGPHKVIWFAEDDSTNKTSATQDVTVVDTTPPKITVTLSPTVLWPPDHKLIPIAATITVEDLCDPNPKVTLYSIASNEPDNGLGDGDTAKDIQQADIGTDDRSFLLRSERGGPGQGREYTITYKATDASGNSTLASANVFVPKSQAASTH